ncbi:MAG TPA: LemA family protein [Steroidobacteraceae bacterium]|nr:LemA family protein [Steroidobacteraceae bacterium]
MAWILLIALAAFAAAVAAAARRGLLGLQDSRAEAWSALEVQLEKRHAHMIRIVGLCARLMKYERDTLDRVTTSGSAVIAAARRGNMPALAAADKTHRAAAGTLFRLAANYPQFGTSKAFKALRDRATTLDARVDEKREQYNGVVSVLNVRCRAFPYSLVARTMGMRPAAYFS